MNFRTWCGRLSRFWDNLLAAGDMGMACLLRRVASTFKKPLYRLRPQRLPCHPFAEALERRCLLSAAPVIAPVSSQDNLTFQANQGQFDAATQYGVQAGNYQGDLGTRGQVTFRQASQGADTAAVDSSAQEILQIGLQGAQDGLQPMAQAQTTDASGTSGYGAVLYPAIYPGIDAVYYGPSQSQMEFDFVIHSGADPSAIVLTYNDASQLQLDDQGDLLVSTAAGDFVQKAPVIYQQIDGLPTPISGNYVLDDNGGVHYQIGAYDPTQDLVIDPNNYFPPVAQNDTYNVVHDHTLSIASPGVLSNDSSPMGLSLTAVLSTGPSHGSLTLNANGSFTYTPNTHYFGQDTWTYRAYDGTGYSNVATVTVNVTDQAPGAVNDTYNVTHDHTLNVASPGILSNDGDGDGDAISATLVANVQHGTLSLNANGSFTYTPTAGFYGTDTFTYKDSDGLQFGNTATVTLHVIEQAPGAQNDTYNANHDHTLTVAAPGVLANDVDLDLDPITAVLVTNAQHGSVTLNSNGSFSYTPHAGYVGGDTFTYKDFDGLLYSSTATVTINVQEHAPVAVNDAYAVFHDHTLTIAAPGVVANDTDAEMDPLSAVLVSNVQHGTLSLGSNGSFSYTPNAGYTGTDTFTYYATDGLMSSNTATVTLTVGADMTSSGAVIVAIKGISFSGVVATFTGGTGSTAAEYSALILWGDGQQSAGTVVANGTSGFNVQGSHTFLEEGSYALAVQIKHVTDGWTKAAVSLAVAVPLQDEMVLQKVQGWSLSSAGTLTQSGTDTGGTFSLSATGSLSYELDTTITEVGDAFTRARDLVFQYTLQEVGTDAAASFTQGAYTISETGTDTLTTTGTTADLAVYSTWSESGTPSVTVAKTGDGGSGTFSETDTETGNITRPEAGTNDTGNFQDTRTTVENATTIWTGSYGTGLYTLSGTNSPTTTDVQTGNVLSETTGATTTVVEAATLSGGGTLGGAYTRVLTGTDTPTGTLTESDSAGSATDTESGSATFTRTAIGSDAGGPLTRTDVRSDTLTTRENGTNQGATDTQTITDQDSSTRTLTGTAATGAFTLSETDSDTSTDNETDSNQGATDISTVTDRDTSTQTETGNFLSGAVTLTGSDTATDTSTDTASNQGATDTDTLIDRDTATENGTANLTSGSYTLNETDSDTSTDNESDSNQGATDARTVNDQDSSTATVSGNYATGAYTRNGTSSDTVTDTENDSNQGATDSSTDNEQDSATESETGNWLTGGFTLHVTETASSTDNEMDSNQGATDTSTVIEQDSITETETGNWDTGAYTLSENGSATFTTNENDSNQGATDSSTSTETDISSETETGNFVTTAFTRTETDVANDTVNETDSNQGAAETRTDIEQDTSTETESGNLVTGAETLTETDNATDTTTENDSNQGATNTSTITDQDHSTRTETFNLFTGLFSLHETDSSTVTDTANDSNQGATDTSTEVEQNSSTDDETGNLVTGTGSETESDTANDTTTENGSNQGATETSTITDQDSSTRTETFNLFTGLFSLHETDSSTLTDTANDSNQGATDTSTEVEQDSSTIDETGNSVTGTGSETETDSANDTTTENDSNQGATETSTTTDQDHSTRTETFRAFGKNDGNYGKYATFFIFSERS